MTTQQVHAAMIEWDSSEVPEMILGTTERIVRLRAAESIQLSGCYLPDDREWFKDDPERMTPPREMTDAQLIEWHVSFREAHTVPWVTFELLEIETE
jgi:hypothetical protein